MATQRRNETNICLVAIEVGQYMEDDVKSELLAIVNDYTERSNKKLIDKQNAENKLRTFRSNYFQYANNIVVPVMEDVAKNITLANSDFTFHFDTSNRGVDSSGNIDVYSVIWKILPPNYAEQLTLETCPQIVVSEDRAEQEAVFTSSKRSASRKLLTNVTRCDVEDLGNRRFVENELNKHLAFLLKELPEEADEE